MSSPARLVLPAAAVIAAAVVFGFVGRNSLPGDALYPARDFLAAVGVARSPGDEADRRIAAARTTLVRARSDQVPEHRLDLAYEAVADLERAEGIARRLDNPGRLATIAVLEDSAGATIADARAERDDDSSGPGSGGDSSGPGSGDDSNGRGSDDSGVEDSSGHGSDDSGTNDSSGHGGGDDSIDSSGHGSDGIVGDSSGHGGSGGGSRSSGSHDSGAED
jgi:hypothetical protein